MKRTCKYHPGKNAVWYCHHDGISFCDECVDQDDESEQPKASCFLCGKSLDMIGRQVAQEPFWNVISRFTRYPVARDPGIIMLAVALAAGVVGFLLDEQVGLAVMALVGVALGKLGADVIESTADGVMKPPVLMAVAKPQNWDIGIQQWLVYALATAVIGYSYISLGMLTGSLIALAVWLFLPALLVALLLDRSLLTLLFTPQRVLAVMFSMGIDYFAAGFYLFLQFSAAAIVASILYDLLPAVLSWPLNALIVGWFYISLQHLLGYLVVQNRESLGYVSEASAAEARKKKARKPKKERRQNVLLREGKFDKLVNEYKQRLEKEGASLDFNEKYHRLLSVLDRQDAMLEQADQYFTALLKQNQQYRVNELLKSYRQIDPAFKPGTALLTWQVAQAASELGQHKLAVSLMQDLHKRAPTWSELPKAYSFMARLLATELGMKDKALQYLKFIEMRFRKPKDQELVNACKKELGL